MPTAALVVNRKRIRHVPHLHRRSVAAAAACGWEMELLETRSADAGHGVTREAVTAGAQLEIGRASCRERVLLEV